jgi:hypothetical protein
VVGFADDVNSFDEAVHHFLEDAEGQGPTNELATYVNQWIYCSSCGMSFPCKLFYNTTSLNVQTLFKGKASSKGQNRKGKETSTKEEFAGQKSSKEIN